MRYKFLILVLPFSRIGNGIPRIQLQYNKKCDISNGNFNLLSCRIILNMIFLVSLGKKSEFSQDVGKNGVPSETSVLAKFLVVVVVLVLSFSVPLSQVVKVVQKVVQVSRFSVGLTLVPSV